jgi:hypothetical protein
MADTNTPMSVYVEGQVTLAEGVYRVKVELAITPKQIVGAVKRLAELGLEPLPAALSAPTANGSARSEGKPAELRQRPAYDGNGDACCPIHNRPLKRGQYGLYCSAKAEPPIGSDRGYCRYTADDE